MQLIPISTPIITTSDNLFDVIITALKNAKVKLQDGDVITIATKIVSVTQGLLIKKDEIKVSEEAKEYAKITQLCPEFMEVAIRESDEVLGACFGALLTRSDGYFMPNAGADQSNAPVGTIIILPSNPSQTAREIQQFLQDKFNGRILRH